MEYVGRKVTKNVEGRGACFGSIESYTPATGLYSVVYDDGNSEEMGLAEVSPLLITSVAAAEGPKPPADFDLNVAEEGGNPPAEFDLNVAASPAFDLNEAGDGEAAQGGLHGLDLNEGINYILHEDPNSKRKLIDLNSEAAADEEEVENPKRVKSFDLNEDLRGADADVDRAVVAPATSTASAGGVTATGESSSSPNYYMEALMRQFLMPRMPSSPLQNYSLFAGRVLNNFPFPPRMQTAAPSPPLYPLPRPFPFPAVPAVPAPLPLPPKAELPPSSAALNLGGASLLDFLSVYSFLRSFSVSLFISPFEIQDFASSLTNNDSSSLFDSIHLSLLTMLRRHLISLSEEGSASASLCLRSLNWELLDSITWPMFLFEYLVFHTPKKIPGMDTLEKDCKYRPFECEYYTMPASAKMAILQHLCDDVAETETCRSEINRRGAMAESNNWNSRYFSCKVKKVARGDGASTSCMVEEYTNEFTDDGNGDECYLCRTEGNLICCDGCPAAYHARCVGISSSLLPEGDWYCPECAIEKTSPYGLTRSVRGLELLGTDPHGRLYYACCQYLLVSDSCNDEFSFSLYNGDDVAAVVTALESSSSNLHARLIRAIRAQWRSADEPAAALDEGNKMENPIILESPEISQNDQNEISGDSQNKGDLGTSGDGSQPPAITNENPTNEDGGAGEPSPSRGTSTDTVAEDIAAAEPCFVNMYEFGRTASSLSKQFKSKGEDAVRPAGRQSMALQMKAISSQYASTSWSNLQNLNPDSRKEKCGWCAGCKLPEDDEVQCLFLRNDSFRAPENFTSGALGIRATGSKKKHLVDVICHLIWMEDRLRGLLSGPWTNPRFSTSWRAIGLDAAHIGDVKKMLLQLEQNIHRRALSADWTKNADSAATMGSASHIVRKQSSTQVHLPKSDSSRSKRKCSRQVVTQTPNDATGDSLSWWRGGRASRQLFHWKVLPRSSDSKAARQGGCNKIAGVNYPDGGEYAKRIRCTAWRAAVGAAKTVDQLALQIRVLDASIKWNEVENINLLPEREPKKPVKSFKTAVIRRQKREGEMVLYLLDFGKSRLIPNLVVKHGSRVLEDGSSTRKKYWLEESHVPLHLLKAYYEKRLLRVATRDAAATELRDSSNEEGVVTVRTKGFEYLFERAERLEYERTTTCEHCTESVLVREAVTCKYCNGLFHASHAKESASTSTAEATYTCHKCWERNEQSALMQSMETAEVQRRRRTRREAVGRNSSIVEDHMATVPEQDLWDSVATMPKKRRTVTNSSYWVNGVHLSRNGDDERLLQFQRSTLRLLPGEDAPPNEDPRCILCDETERAANLNYVSCEICGDWFHGDALDLSDDRMELIIGFECHKCLHKRPPVCPHQRPTEDVVPSEESGSEVGDSDYSHDSEETSSV